MPMMRVKDLEQLQATLNQAGYDYQLELEEEKIQMFLSLGSVVGILIDSDKETLTVYRPTGESTMLGNGEILTIPELFPGWELPIAEVWPPVFDEEE